MRGGRQAILLGLALSSVAVAASTELPVGRIVPSVQTARDIDQSYALYLPSSYPEPDRLYPVLFVLDPRGRAVPGVERFLPAAEEHGYVVLSSYQSRSDSLREINVKALDALLIEAQSQYQVDPKRIYLGGMSGTAHAAWRFAQFLKPAVAGVVAAAGGVQESSQGPPGEADFAYYGIISHADFNYQEMMRLEEHLLGEGIDHRIDVVDGRHGWPPHEFTNRALDWMEFQAMKRGLRPADGDFIAEQLERARGAISKGLDSLEELRRRRDIARDFQDLGATEDERSSAERLASSAAIAKRRKIEKELARDERTYVTRRYAPWLGALQSKERRPPTVRQSLVELRIQALLKQAAEVDDPPRAHSAQRTLENLYVGVAFYHPRDFERAGDTDRQIRSLQVAVEIFPNRAGAHWRLASVLVGSSRLEEGFAALRAAIRLGGVDVPRIERDPVWEPLRDREEWWSTVLAEAKLNARRSD